MTASTWTIEWSDKLSMSHPDIDAEHQQFIKLVNELNDVISQQQDKVVIERIMGLILEDAIAHFSNEEQILAEKSYPAAQEHILMHVELINHFNQAMEKIQVSKIRAVWIKTGLEIKDKLVDHLLNEDAKYIEHLQAE